MIWLWISIAIILSLLFLIKKKIAVENLIWVLLPVDMYGFDIGFTLKPYMLFSVFLFIKLLLKKDKKVFVGNGSVFLFWILCPLIIVLSLFNGGNMTSVMASMMFFAVFICAIIYASVAFDSYKQIPDVLIATSIGFGIVFIIAYIMTTSGNILDGFFTTDRMMPGIVMRFNNYQENELFSVMRLRGFFLDPNVVVGTFLAPVVINIINIICKKVKLINIISLIISLTCIVMTNSRMSFVIGILTVIISIRIAVNGMVSPNKKAIKMWLAFIVVIIVFVLIISGVAVDLISSYINSFKRAGLTDTNGRLTIWIASFKAWIKNGLVSGIGFGQVKYFNNIGRECHNNWLEWLVSCGLFLGLIIDISFFSQAFIAIKNRLKEYSQDMLVYNGVMFGLIGTMLGLFTVDNITNSYLIFYLVTMNMILIKNKKEETKKDLEKNI